VGVVFLSKFCGSGNAVIIAYEPISRKRGEAFSDRNTLPERKFIFRLDFQNEPDEFPFADWTKSG
jgi:hypothetical protein